MPITLYGGLSVLTLCFSLLRGCESSGLGGSGTEVDLVERSIRRGEGDPELADALRREAEGKCRGFSEAYPVAANGGGEPVAHSFLRPSVDP